MRNKIGIIKFTLGSSGGSGIQVSTDSAIVEVFADTSKSLNIPQDRASRGKDIYSRDTFKSRYSSFSKYMNARESTESVLITGFKNTILDMVGMMGQWGSALSSMGSTLDGVTGHKFAKQSLNAAMVRVLSLSEGMDIFGKVATVDKLIDSYREHGSEIPKHVITTLVQDLREGLGQSRNSLKEQIKIMKFLSSRMETRYGKYPTPIGIEDTNYLDLGKANGGIVKKQVDLILSQLIMMDKTLTGDVQTSLFRAGNYANNMQAPSEDSYTGKNAFNDWARDFARHVYNEGVVRLDHEINSKYFNSIRKIAEKYDSGELNYLAKNDDHIKTLVEDFKNYLKSRKNEKLPDGLREIGPVKIDMSIGNSFGPNAFATEFAGFAKIIKNQEVSNAIGSAMNAVYGFGAVPEELKKTTEAAQENANVIHPLLSMYDMLGRGIEGTANVLEKFGVKFEKTAKTVDEKGPSFGQQAAQFALVFQDQLQTVFGDEAATMITNFTAMWANENGEWGKMWDENWAGMLSTGLMALDAIDGKQSQAVQALAGGLGQLQALKSTLDEEADWEDLWADKPEILGPVLGN